MERPEAMPPHDKNRSERDKLRELDFKGKLEYIWEYYKLIIIGAVIALVIIGSLVNTYYFNPQPATALFIAWNAGYIFDEEINALTDALEERLIEEGENSRVIVSHFSTSYDEAPVMMANAERLVAMLAAGSIDVFIVGRELLQDYSYGEYLLPMEGLLAELKSNHPAVYGRIEERFTYALYGQEEGNVTEYIMGVSLAESPLFSGIGFYQQELYFAVAASTRNYENVINALIVFFE